MPEVLNGYRQGQSTKGGRPKPGPGRRPVGQPPTQRKHENNQQYPLPQMFPTLGPLAMGSQRAIVITEGFSQRTARANPATIGPLAKKVHQPGNEHERLDDRDHKPEGTRLPGQHIVNEQGIRQDKSIPPPVIPMRKGLAPRSRPESSRDGQ